MAKTLSDVTLGQLLSQFDKHLLFLLERRYLDSWNRNLNHFVPSASRSDWQESFYGFKIDGIRHFGEPSQDLALQNMENFLGLYRDGSHSFLCAIDGSGRKVPEVSFLSCKTQESHDAPQVPTKEYAKGLRMGLRANFPGAQVTSMGVSEYSALAEWCYKVPHMGMLTGVPGRKKHEEKFFAQGLDRFLDAISGYDFLCLVVGEPYSVRNIISFIDPVLKIKNEVGQLEKFTTSENESITDTRGNTVTVGTYLGGGVSDSRTLSDARTSLGAGSVLTSPAAATGAAIGAMIGNVFPGVGNLIGAGVGIAVGTLVGGVGALATGLPLATTVTEAISHAASYMGGGFGSLARSRSTAYTQGRTIGREAVNHAARYAMEKLDEYMVRLRNARSYGMWNVGFYFFANDPISYVALRNAAIANFSGEQSGFDPLRFIDLDFGDLVEGGEPIENAAHALERRKGVISEIVAGFNPRVQLVADINKNLGIGHHPLGACFDSLSTALTTSELAIMVAPPQRECKSISVSERGAFAGKVAATDWQVQKGEKPLVLGCPLYFGDPQDIELKIPIDSLTRHAFVTGITGSGKTNTIKNWCRQLSDADIPWLVIEPSAKREYRTFLSEPSSKPVVFSLGNEGIGLDSVDAPLGAPFRLNPFYFEKGVALLTHLDAIKACFSAAFPMYASMPYILEEAIVTVYEDRGWRLSDSANRFSDTPWDVNHKRHLFPTLRDLHDRIDTVVRNKRYDQRLEMDISAALRARIGSLLLGSKGAMLDTPVSLAMKDLVKSNVVLEMGSMGSDDEKAFVMGLMIMTLCEHAVQAGLSGGGKLRHVLIVEEAHRLLRNTVPADNPEIANIRGAAVEQFANMLAEMRAFGQGIIIVDQVPSKLLPDVIKNTNLKMVHQLCAADDRRAVGDTMVLDDRQKDELARLEPRKGQAVVFQQQWERAYCVTIAETATTELAPHLLRETREDVIRSHPDVYGTQSEYVGINRSEAQSVHGLDLARVLMGLALGNAQLFQVGISPFVPRYDALSNKKTTTSASQGPLYSAFDAFLLDVMRMTSARLNLFTECPEMFRNLVGEVVSGSGDVARLFAALRSAMLAAAIEAGDGILLRAASDYYARTFDLGRIPVEIGRTKESGDAAFTTLREQLSEHTRKLCAGVVADTMQRRVELGILEQAVVLAGFFNAREVVENYRSRYM